MVVIIKIDLVKITKLKIIQITVSQSYVNMMTFYDDVNNLLTKMSFDLRNIMGPTLPVTHFVNGSEKEQHEKKTSIIFCDGSVKLVS